MSSEVHCTTTILIKLIRRPLVELRLSPFRLVFCRSSKVIILATCLGTFRPLLTNVGVNIPAASVSVDSFICPSVGGVRGSTENDSDGFGFTDYAPIILVDDIFSFTQQYELGAYNGRSQRRISSVTDGTSNTIGIAETTGRDESYMFAGNTNSQGVTCAPEGVENATNAVWRWADPSNSFIVSDRVNTNRNDPTSWVAINAGPNGETFAFHTGGANANYVDGSTHFISDTVDQFLYANTCGATDGQVNIIPQ